MWPRPRVPLTLLLSPITIQPATVADAPDVCAFLASFRAEWLPTASQYPPIPAVADEASFIAASDGAGGVMLLARDRQRVVGCLTATVHTHPQRKHACEFGMGVLAAYRGRGVGGRLLDQLACWAQTHGQQRIELVVLANNVGAIRLYQRHGYVREGRQRAAIRVGEQCLDLVLMSRGLLAA